MRATRDLLRRRLHLGRPRAARLTPMRQTNSQDHLPPLGTPLKSQVPRAGVAQRFADPAVQQNIEVELALLDADDRLSRDLEPQIMTAAQQHDPPTRERLRLVPGMGPIVSWVLLYDIHAIHRVPRGQEFASSCRVVKCAHESAGTR
jgi:transposase